jgi:hypothetical protein
LVPAHNCNLMLLVVTTGTVSDPVHSSELLFCVQQHTGTARSWAPTLTCPLPPKALHAAPPPPKQPSLHPKQPSLPPPQRLSLPAQRPSLPPSPALRRACWPERAHAEQLPLAACAGGACNGCAQLQPAPEQNHKTRTHGQHRSLRATENAHCTLHIANTLSDLVSTVPIFCFSTT